jgi:hypothetical protein
MKASHYNEPDNEPEFSSKLLMHKRGKRKLLAKCPFCVPCYSRLFDLVNSYNHHLHPCKLHRIRIVKMNLGQEGNEPTRFIQLLGGRVDPRTLLSSSYLSFSPSLNETDLL